jgi:hypothetical protein
MCVIGTELWFLLELAVGRKYIAIIKISDHANIGANYLYFKLIIRLTISIIDYRTASIFMYHRKPFGRKIQQRVVGGWVGEEIVPRPLASVLLTGRRQKR